MKVFIPFLIFIFLYGCKNNERTGAIYIPSDVKYRFMNYENYYPVWRAKGSSNSSIAFHKDGCSYFYNAKQSQQYRYRNLSERNFDLIWSTKHNDKIEILLNEYNGMSVPKEGDTFAKYSVINDSTIKVDYIFKEWTDKVNELTQDSIFPKYLHSSLYQ